MHQISIQKDRAETLKLDAAAIKKRMEQVSKKLRTPIVDLVSPAIESHVMVFGPHFDTGVELASFAIDLTEFVIAGLMEQGKLPKKLPSVTPKKDDEATHPGNYL